jgi:hypothetical protein
MYENVHALLIRWKETKTDFLTQLSGLKDVLERKYNFNTVPLDIPSGKPTLFLQKKIPEFFDTYDGPKTLLILYYIGHGAVNRGRLIWKRSVLPSDHDVPYFCQHDLILVNLGRIRCRTLPTLRSGTISKDCFSAIELPIS